MLRSGRATGDVARHKSHGLSQMRAALCETFWEPGGEVIHYQDGNALSDAHTKFVVFMLCEPGQPMLTYVEEEELAQRAHLRAPRPTGG
ncbi:hypothetical protein AB0H88_25010 [Nonomuraea sp. NPDC050680]|uniref:hypothetical protein n=1 Tax=Nonomuraea sp. NPDC050680 TaxID=3154630 RepID=UPI0033C588EA